MKSTRMFKTEKALILFVPILLISIVSILIIFALKGMPSQW